MRGHLIAIAAFAAMMPLGVSAQSAGADAAAGSGCELHVWPSSGLHSVYHGWLHGGIVDGAVNGREGYPAVATDPVDTPTQASLLTDAHPNILLDRRGDRVVVHPNALTSREIRTTTARLSPSTAPCYAELIVDDVFLQQDIVNGAFVKTLFRFRQFGPGPAPERVFGTWVKTRLSLFPPKTEQETAASQAEFKTAYTNNIALFAAALAKPPHPKH